MITTMRIRGYCSRPSVAPGDRIAFHASCDQPGPFEAQLMRIVMGDGNPDGPGPKMEPVEATVNGTYAGETQRTQVGGYVEIPDPDGQLALTGGFTIFAFIHPTAPDLHRQAVISRWREPDAAGWALLIEDGALTLAVGDGEGRVARVVSNRRLFPDTWYAVAATYDPSAGALRLTQRTVVNAVNGREGPVVPLDSSCAVAAHARVTPADADVPVLIAGLAEPDRDGRIWSVASYNGKVDAPMLYRRALDGDEIAALARGERVAPDALAAHWDFAAGTTAAGIGTDLVRDVSGSGLDGRCVNIPDRGMTGWNWRGREENFTHAPEEYGAIWFHEDSLDDCRWPAFAQLEIPSDLRSGCYALRIAQGEHHDDIVFFVTPPRGTATAPIAVLMPTWSYIAYANVRTSPEADVAQAVFAHTTVVGAQGVELHERGLAYGLSTYDHHADGRGNQYSSWRRPILNLRPDFRYAYDTVWNFQSDLHIIDWLEASGFPYDVITDDELHQDGADALRPYNVVITGTHPEYCSWEMIDGWEEYLAGGGRGMYLGGNGMYWVTSAHPEKPYLLEVRRGETGDQSWRARPGEHYHATTGERGGLWRNRGRAPQKVWGTGMTSHMLDKSAPYYVLPDGRDPRVAWIMEGIDLEQPIGAFGLVGDGAAGQEVDRYDRGLGSPSNALLLASSYGHTPYDMLVPEDQFYPDPSMNGEEHPLIRADLVFFTTPNGGAMFSASSLTWATSLSHDGYDNNVARLTGNVLRRFAADEPIPPVV